MSKSSIKRPKLAFQDKYNCSTTDDFQSTVKLFHVITFLPNNVRSKQISNHFTVGCIHNEALSN